jgi:hypothetical protein
MSVVVLCTSFFPYFVNVFYIWMAQDVYHLLDADARGTQRLTPLEPNFIGAK